MTIIIPKEDETYKDYITRILNSRENKKDESNYQERHHITPKCVGGTNEETNLIYLYYAEHYYAHELLAIENVDNVKLVFAWWVMCRKDSGETSFNSFNYEIIKKKASEYISYYNRKENLSEETIRKMSESHKGQNLGASNPRARAVRCLNNGLVFPTIKSAAEYGHTQKTTISRQISGVFNYAGRHPETGEELKWEYVNPNFHKTSKETIDKMRDSKKDKITGAENPRARKVRCIDNGMIFGTTIDAGKYAGVTGSTIGSAAKGDIKSAGTDPVTGQRLHWEYVTENNMDNPM